MKIQELLTEGAFVIKSKDGVEKRFKSEGPESKAWANSTVKKPTDKTVKFEKYGKAYWEKEDEKAWGRHDDNFVLPWDPIYENDLNNLSLAKAFDDAGFNEINDFTTIGKSFHTADKDHHDMPVSAQKIRVQVVHDLKADFGYDDETIAKTTGRTGADQDGKVLDSQGIVIKRDTKNPKKFVFSTYF